MERTVASSLQTVSESLWLLTTGLGYPLADWVDDQRDAGKSWRSICIEVRDKTDGHLDLPPQTLLNWYGASQAAA